jgi:TonB family protein
MECMMKSKLLFTVTLFVGAAFAQPKPVPTVPGSMNWILHIEAGQFIGVADAMPADKWSFAPSNGEFTGVRTFAGQVWHVACANEGFAAELEGKAPPKGCEVISPEHQSGTKDKLMPYLRETFERVQRAIETITPANMLEEVDTLYPGGKRTRLSIAATAVYHAADHYGQIVEYLRMNGIVPGARPQRGDTVPAANPSILPKRITMTQKDARANLTQQVAPVYPPEAKMRHITGDVSVEVLIGVDGRVKRAQVAGTANTYLADAALDAIKKWRYKQFTDPDTNSPVEVQTVIVIHFTIS